jgi:DNA-binding transcriptional LysR family regulator
VEIYQLRAFVAVARLGHLTRASEQLHVTQPAVSKQIKALEDELGVTLFERTPAGMTLTKAGISLAPRAEKMLQQADGLLAAARELSGNVSGLLKLGTIIDPESLRLGDFLGRVLLQHPMIDIKLHHGISGLIKERVSAGELDAGFYLGPVNEPRLQSIELKQVSYCVISPPAWEAQLTHADWKTLAAMPWVGTPPQSSQHRIVQQMFAGHGLVPNYAVEADQEASMLSLVRSGAALCIMREELAVPAEMKGELRILSGYKQTCPLSFLYVGQREIPRDLQAAILILKKVWELDESDICP